MLSPINTINVKYHICGYVPQNDIFINDAGFACLSIFAQQNHSHGIH